MPVPSASTPRKPGEPQSRGAAERAAAGSRSHSLEAQQTKTFILRHFQCRLWVGAAGGAGETGLSGFLGARTPPPHSPPPQAASFRASLTLWTPVLGLRRLPEKPHRSTTKEPDP